MTDPKSMSDAALRYTRQDLHAVIAVQEAGARQGMHCPKLGTYWDELGAVIGEMNRRAGKSS